MKITRELLREILDYNPTTGDLIWKVRSKKWFTNERISKSWNARYASKIAGCTRPDTYKVIGIFDTSYLQHTIIWVWMTGKMPRYELDHKDRNPNNNAWGNLRDIPHVKNRRNQRKNKNNTSGVTGVRKTKIGRFETFITMDGKYINLGTYLTIEEAALVRQEAQKRYGFTSGHGT